MGYDKSYLLGSSRNSRVIYERKMNKELTKEKEQFIEIVDDITKENRKLKNQLEKLKKSSDERNSELGEKIEGFKEQLEIIKIEQKNLQQKNEIFYKKIRNIYEMSDEFKNITNEQSLNLKELFFKLEEDRELYNTLQKQFLMFSNENKKIIDCIENEKKLINYKFNEKNEEQVAIVKELMKVKWKEIERYAREREKDVDILECLICGNKEQRKNLKVKKSECIFNGGSLERYVCSCCGAIFGPTKFLNLSQQEKNEDYYIHYLGFSEGDSTEKELRAFKMLNPKKEGIYLNYGCGNWSKSLQILKEEGYTVYGYEPYAKKDNNNPNLITEKSVLTTMRFDGIYSNDVIEHFNNPVEDFKYMKSLLRDSNSRMSHSTSCYMYRHAETRFHTYFFTGDSLQYLCKKSGIEICEIVNEIETKDFICYTFRNIDEYENMMNEMLYQGKIEKQEEQMVIYGEGIVYGPYINLSKGKFDWEIELFLEGTDSVSASLTAESGKKVLMECSLKNGINLIQNELVTNEDRLELVILINKGVKATIKRVLRKY